MENRNKIKQRKNNRIKCIIRVCITCIFFAILVYILCGIYKESKIRLVEVEENNNTGNIIQTKQETIKTKVDINIPKIYLGHKVSSKLEIPKIELTSNVLEEYTKEGLEKCLSKYWGPNPNEIGNYCIAGHNYDKENMFNHLIDLEIGDKIYLIDNNNGKCVYTIYDIYRVKPQNIKPLSQDTKGKKEITLITCVNYSANRLIIKAIETKF